MYFRNFKYDNYRECMENIAPEHVSSEDDLSEHLLHV